jgi:hypothetical protein
MPDHRAPGRLGRVVVPALAAALLTSCAAGGDAGDVARVELAVTSDASAVEDRKAAGGAPREDVAATDDAAAAGAAALRADATDDAALGAAEPRAARLLATSTPATAADLGHVHDLALNEADSRVYAGTHHGLFVLLEGAAYAVGDDRQDVMALTAAGPDTLLISGHPGPGEPGSANLGLLASNDGGLSWTELALGGQVDFHSLTTAGEHVYGFDATTGTVLRSDDGGASWTGGAVLGLRDLDADPTADGRLVATTDAGLVVSDDGGATFGAHDHQPPEPLLLVDHAGPALVGLGLDGTVWSLQDGTWHVAGSPGGAPEAFLALDEETLLAAVDAVVLRSEDSGQTWDAIS